MYKAHTVRMGRTSENSRLSCAQGALASCVKEAREGRVKGALCA